jgi:ArsR family transcriptional regulator, lead/cadmium/zinc/bismuth-responsive transcriptional repressor
MVIKADPLTPIDPEAVAQAAAAIPATPHISMSAETFNVLANPTRLRILYSLMAHSLCVRDLSILVGVSESAVSHQLRILRDRRVVKTKREGNVIRYVLDDMHVAAMLREADYHADHVQRGLNDHPYSLAHRQE